MLSHTSKTVRILWFHVLTYSGKYIAFYLAAPKLMDGPTKRYKFILASN